MADLVQINLPSISTIRIVCRPRIRCPFRFILEQPHGCDCVFGVYRESMIYPDHISSCYDGWIVVREVVDV